MENIIGIIGFGNMGSSIAGQLKAKYKLLAFDKDKSKTKTLDKVYLAESIRDLISKARVLLLAIKPQDMDSLLREIRNGADSKLIISIAAGINTKYIEKILGRVRLIRAMPNIGVKIGESVTCLCKGEYATDDDLDFAKELFYYLGVTKEIEEGMMDAATAISGSGPAYIFDFIAANSLNPYNIPEHARHDMIRRLERAAGELGFTHEDAMFLAVNTTATSISLLQKTNLAPEELVKQVASKGGTTEKALEVLHSGGTWEEAAQAALKRAQDLARR